MSKFLENILSDLNTNNLGGMIKAKLKLNALGENARLMLEIGILQDELVKMGFEPDGYEDFGFSKYIDNNNKNINDRGKFFVLMSGTAIELWWSCANGYRIEYEYSSSTWQQDLLNKVKELINE